MVQVFHPSMNTLSRVSIFGSVFILGAVAWALDAVNRSAWSSQVGVAVEQPVPFSHKHHVQGLGLDCRYCHTSVEDTAFAGIPPTKTCMACHSQLWTESEILEPIRESYRTDRPVEWVRVHDLPDYVYFDHSIHLAKGVGCVSCHGQVDEMPLMWRANDLTMDWCLTCHRNPGPYLQPRDTLFDMNWDPVEAGVDTHALVEAHNVQSLTNCSTCHR